MSKTEVTHLLWIDLETTGLDEHEDAIVEVAAIVTNLALKEIDRYRQVAGLTGDAWSRLSKNDFVRQMHRDNGLLEEMVDSQTSLRAIDANIVRILEMHRIERHGVMLAGSGVGHFDRRFIRWQMPKTEEYLAYPVMDIGVMRRFLTDLCHIKVPPFNEGKTHRAIVDVECHLAEGRWLFENLKAWHDVWENKVWPPSPPAGLTPHEINMRRLDAIADGRERGDSMG